MISIQHVVCPVDFSEQSRRALEYAASLAGWYEARLTVLHVFANLPVIDAVPHLKGQPLALKDVNAEQLRAALAEFVGESSLPIPVAQQVVEASDSRRGIVTQLDVLKPDLLVMGTHGRSGFERLVLGSVTERVLPVARCPVLAIPPHARGPAHAGPFKRILAAIDFSAASLNALKYALDLAEEADAEITVLYVIEMPPELHEAGVTAGIDVAQIRAAAEAEALRRLRELIPADARTYCTVHTEVSEGRAYREIVRLADARQADLVVMGVRGRSAFDRLVFGSNTHSVLTTATCPVLAVS